MTNLVETMDYPLNVDETWNRETFKINVPITTEWVFFASPDSTFNVDPLESLIERWTDVAVSHARVRLLDDVFVADVVGVPGAWSSASTGDAALLSLREVLIDWVRMKLDDGDTDIPQMEGIRLVLEP
jgi:predicted RNase H-like HicB family nuclease